MLKGLNATFSLLVSLVHDYFMFSKMVMTAVLYLDHILSNLTHNDSFFHAKKTSNIRILLKDIDYSMYVSGLSCTPVVSVILAEWSFK